MDGVAAGAYSRVLMESPSSPIYGSCLSRRLPPELGWLWREIRPHLRWHLASFICIACASLLALLPPLALGWLIDKILPQREPASLLALVALLFLSFQGRNLLSSLGAYLTVTAAQKLSLQLRLSVLRHLDTLSADYYETTPVGRVIYPLQQPIEQVAYFGSDLLPSILRLLLTVVFTVSTMFVLSPSLTLSVVPLVPAFLIARQHFAKKLAMASDVVQQGQTLWADFLHQHFAAVIPIQLLAQEKRQERRAFHLLGRLARSQQTLFRTGAFFAAFTSMSVVMAMSVGVGYGGWRVFAGSLSAGRLVAFYGFIAQLFEPLSSASEIYARAQIIFANIRKVQQVFLERPSILNLSSAAPLSVTHGWPLEIDRVEFRYPSQSGKLRIPSLRIPPGDQVAIVGENGAGKSTLAKLLMRIYDVKAGAISIGGIDIRHVTLDSLHRNLCYLPRDPVLFHGNLASNLRFANPATSNSQLEEVLALAGLSTFVDNARRGLREEIGQDGCQLSGGQRQRLAIARALLQQPCILVLDEATSCLDPVSESLILGNIRRHLPAATLIIITHRLSTLSLFPRVLVFSNGRIVGDGAPAELTTQCDVYASLFSTRSSTGEYSLSS
ncbi:MAG: Methionine transporter ATP-binding protein [Candidatus Sulfotelmatobacter sp.]|nr:Methionine transporter ATP-binding protein [Candidatus Sulfotelmatobacter sp.]